MRKGLKAFDEVLETICCQKSNSNLKNCVNTVETELKSWDIVSEYVDVFILGGLYYLQLNGVGILPITEEQYNVLKEAIKDE